MPFEIAKAGIDDFFRCSDSRHIRFYGPGEPTQELEIMREITDYAREKAGSELKVELQTNGVFGVEVREWLLRNLNIIWFSFDGEPEVQDMNRPLASGRGSSYFIENNVKWINNNKSNRDIMTGARVTITKNNISRQKEMIDYFINLGIRYIWTDPVFPTVGKIPVCLDKTKLTNYDFDMDLYVDNFIEAYKYSKEKEIFYGSFLACNFDGKTNIHCRACIPVPHLTPDGYISACDLVTFGEKAYHMDSFVYGKWSPGSKSFIFDQDKIDLMRKRRIENMEHCKDCRARFYCGGYCLGEVLNETGTLFGQKAKNCAAILRLYDEIGVQDEYEYLHP